jgi:MFS family permease
MKHFWLSSNYFMRILSYILPIIIFSQFCCTSLWFAGNGVLMQLSKIFQLPPEALGHLTAAVQLGFITGTLMFALFTIADRFSPSKVFFVCALLGASINITMLWNGNTLLTLGVIRFITGFFLAGIYPVGMKIAADYFNKGLGKSLGYLVGALVLGTAFPHFVNFFSTEILWQWVIITTSGIASMGGLLLVLLVPDGPYRTAAPKLNFHTIPDIFKNKKFREAAFGYFGHMWELYAFWAFVPFILVAYNKMQPSDLNIAFWSFLIISVGSLGCILGGYLSKYFGGKKVAIASLLLSGGCCIISPMLFFTEPAIFIPFLLFWGFAVIADSPMFSTLVAQNTQPSSKGTALTVVNAIGFSITIVSIQLVSLFSETIEPQFLFLILFLGPVFGLFSLLKTRYKIFR